MTTTRKIVDWEAVERDYRAGIKTLRAMAEEHGITHGAINKRAKRDMWTRDLAAKAELRKKAPVRVDFKDPADGAGFVYVIYLNDSSNDRFYKIGMSASFSDRIVAHQCSSPFEIYVACAYFVGNMRDEEKALHNRFGENRVRGEWFRLDDDDIDFIASRARLI